MSKGTGPTVGELTRYKRPENVLLMPDASGEFVLYETAEAELTRLRGEVERLTARAETAEARVREFEDALAEATKPYVDENGTVWFVPTAWAYAQACTARNSRAERAEARVKELETAVVQLQVDNDQCFGILQGTEARVKELVSERDRAVKAYTDEAQAHDVTRAQLAELRARVRPSFGEIGRELARVCKTTVTTDSIGRTLAFANLSDMAQAIHDILPPVPKVLGEVLNMLEYIVFLVDPQDDVDCEELFQAVVARIGIVKDTIHKAMGGEE